MDRKAIKEFMYGGVAELMRNRDYYYNSTVGAEYSHWTDAGQKAIAEYMHIIGHKMLQAEEAELTQRAKDLVLKGLKGDSK
jgi:hypothetical protein